MFLEKTQFSMVEYNTFIAENREPKNERENFMARLKSFLGSQHTQVTAMGGLDNIQRVRVLEDKAGMAISHEFVLKLPVSVLAAKKHEAAQKERREKIATLKAQKKAAANKPAPKKPRKQTREQFLRSPEGAKAAYDAALRQDLRQRHPKPEQKVA